MALVSPLRRTAYLLHLKQRTTFTKLCCTVSPGIRNFSKYESAPPSPHRSYWQSLKWFSIPASVGFGFICIVQLRKVWKREKRIISEGGPEDQLLPDWQVSLISRIPCRILSRGFGWIMETHLPTWSRTFIFGILTDLFGGSMDEAILSNPKDYASIQELFTRKLKPDVRPVSKNYQFVSPADGRILECGEITDTLHLEQVKGITYPLDIFLGPGHPFMDRIKDVIAKRTRNEKSDKVQNDKGLFYCLVYLAPGDCHWFHSPCRWTITHRRHIPGNLLPVRPGVLQAIRGIFHLNERVLLSGENADGEAVLFGAVGAYNVGSINLDMEEDLRTNRASPASDYDDCSYGHGVCVDKGAAIGHFRMGSSVVLVFTAPRDFQFCVERGAKVKYGNALGNVKLKEL